MRRIAVFKGLIIIAVLVDGKCHQSVQFGLFYAAAAASAASDARGMFADPVFWVGRGAARPVAEPAGVGNVPRVPDQRPIVRRHQQFRLFRNQHSVWLRHLRRQPRRLGRGEHLPVQRRNRHAGIRRQQQRRWQRRCRPAVRHVLPAGGDVDARLRAGRRAVGVGRDCLPRAVHAVGGLLGGRKPHPAAQLPAGRGEDGVSRGLEASAPGLFVAAEDAVESQPGNGGAWVEKPWKPSGERRWDERVFEQQVV